MRDDRRNQGQNPYLRRALEEASFGDKAPAGKGEVNDVGTDGVGVHFPTPSFKDRFLKRLVGKGNGAVEGIDGVVDIVEPLLGHIPVKAAAVYTVAMAINAYCADSELLLPRLGGPQEERPGLLGSLQQMVKAFRADSALMKPLAEITAHRLLRELFGRNPPTHPEVLEQMLAAGKTDYYKEFSPRKAFDSGEKELERDFPWVVGNTLFNPKILDLMGPPMIDISLSLSDCAVSTIGANHCDLLLRKAKESQDSSSEQALIPGAGLNGLRLLPHVWRINFDDVCAVDRQWDYPQCRASVLVNDCNPFVAEVWNSVDRRGAIPQGPIDVQFIPGSLGGDEYLGKITNPISVVLSQVQDAGPEALVALIKHAAEKHADSGHRDELRVHVTLQGDRIEPDSAVISDLEPTLKDLGFRLCSDRPFRAFRKCPTAEGRELDFTEFSFDDYNMLRSEEADSSATPVQMGRQIWEKAGTDGFKTVWVKDSSGFF